MIKNELEILILDVLDGELAVTSPFDGLESSALTDLDGDDLLLWVAGRETNPYSGFQSVAEQNILTFLGGVENGRASIRARLIDRANTTSMRKMPTEFSPNRTVAAT